MVRFGGKMISTIIYYIVKIIVTIWFIGYLVLIAGLHVPFTKKNDFQNMFIFASSLLFTSIFTFVLWANEIYHLGGN